MSDQSDFEFESQNEIDKHGQDILKLLHSVEAERRQALETSQRLSRQLQKAENRIAELEAEVQLYKAKMDRAKQWLHTNFSLRLKNGCLASAQARPFSEKHALFGHRTTKKSVTDLPIGREYRARHCSGRDLIGGRQMAVGIGRRQFISGAPTGVLRRRAPRHGEGHLRSAYRTNAPR